MAPTEPIASNTAEHQPPSLIEITYRGRIAELAIDTGHKLRTGRTWRAFARVYCNDAFSARLTADSLRERIENAVANARAEAYSQGYRDAQAAKPPRRQFSGAL